jgi:hypothetical protein
LAEADAGHQRGRAGGGRGAGGSGRGLRVFGLNVPCGLSEMCIVLSVRWYPTVGSSCVVINLTFLHIKKT